MSFDLKQLAHGLGWTNAAVCEAEVPQDWVEQYQEWIRDYKGDQMKYLERRLEERLHPQKYLPTVKSVLCFSLYYYPGKAKGQVKVSNYSWSRDYHEVLKEKLEKTVLELQKYFKNFDYRIAVDTAPILEKKWAEKAGLGWQGKNTLLIHPKDGSYLFLGEILTSLPVENFKREAPITNHCGTCTRCIDACPTEALEPYVLKADQCISYWTLEHKGPFTDKTPDFQNWVAGCDICQEVCPWNQKVIPLQSGYDATLQNLEREDIEDESWIPRISKIAASYVPPASWQRNLDHLDKFKRNK